MHNARCMVGDTSGWLDADLRAASVLAFWDGALGRRSESGAGPDGLLIQ